MAWYIVKGDDRKPIEGMTKEVQANIMAQGYVLEEIAERKPLVVTLEKPVDVSLGGDVDPDDDTKELPLVDPSPLAEGDAVIAQYKGKERTGVIDHITGSGVVWVALDDDDASYRRIDDDYVRRA